MIKKLTNVTLVVLAPSKEIIIAWLENLFPNEIASGKLTVAHVSEWGADKGFTFSKTCSPGHSIQRQLDVEGPIRRYLRTTTLLCAYDGAQLILLDGSDRYRNASMILRAEALQLDELIRKNCSILHEVGGWYQYVLRSSARQCTMPSPQLISMRDFSAKALCHRKRTRRMDNKLLGGATNYLGGCIPATIHQSYSNTHLPFLHTLKSHIRKSNTLYSRYTLETLIL